MCEMRISKFHSFRRSTWTHQLDVCEQFTHTPPVSWYTNPRAFAHKTITFAHTPFTLAHFHIFSLCTDKYGKYELTIHANTHVNSNTNPHAIAQKIITFVPTTRWRRFIGCLILIGQFPQKSRIISASFAKRDLQLITHTVHLCHPVHSHSHTLHFSLFLGIHVDISFHNSHTPFMSKSRANVDWRADSHMHTHIHTPHVNAYILTYESTRNRLILTSDSSYQSCSWPFEEGDEISK